MAETAELDTTQEEVSKNGHDETWQTFDDDNAFLQHILAQKPLEELVKIPEWHVEVLCRSLNAEDRITIQLSAYDEKTKRTDFRKVFYAIVVAGCFNPTTGNRAFTDKHKETLMQHGGAIERLAMTILRLSGMLAGGEAQNAKKN